MRKLSACLAAAILCAAPAAVAGPHSQPRDRDPWSETVEESGSQARLGVLAMSMTPELRAYFGAPNDRGVLIGKVEPGSAAAAAGLRVGDVLVNVRGDAVDDASDVRAALMGAKQGDTIKIQLVRDKKTMTLDTALRGTATSELGWLHEMFPWLDGLRDAPMNRPKST